MYKIKVVGHLTDLSPHVIRAWEKRYGVIKPQRTDTNRRLYTEQDVEKLRLLSRLTHAGHAISDLADASLDQLHHLVQELDVLEHAVPDAPDPSAEHDSPEAYVTACLEAIGELDGVKLERLLQQANISLSKPRLLDDMLAPLLQRLGDLWESGDLRVAHEHLAAAIVRTFLAGLLGNYQPPANAPYLVVCTLTGQHHELGGLMVGVRAAAMGWRVIYLGPCLPAEDIAAAVNQLSARALAISLVHPPADPAIEREIVRLRRAVPGLPIIAGGRAAESYAAWLDDQQIVHVDSLTMLASFLKESRTAPGQA